MQAIPLRAAERFLASVAIWIAAIVFADRLFPIDARQRESSDVCRFRGRVISNSIPLPGVGIGVWSGVALKTATSTVLDGSYRVALPRGDYRLTAELPSGFSMATPPFSFRPPAMDVPQDPNHASEPHNILKKN